MNKEIEDILETSIVNLIDDYPLTVMKAIDDGALITSFYTKQDRLCTIIDFTQKLVYSLEQYEYYSKKAYDELFNTKYYFKWRC